MERGSGSSFLAMKTETEQSTILFFLALIFCLLSTVAISLTLKPSKADTH